MSTPPAGPYQLQEIPPYRPGTQAPSFVVVIDPNGTFVPPGASAAAAPEPIDIQQYLTPVTTSTLAPEDRICGICTEAYHDTPSQEQEKEPQHTPVKLPCGHVFGSECITSWLSPETGKSNTCPMCRLELFPAQQPPRTIGDGQGEWIRVDTADIPDDVLAALQRQMQRQQQMQGGNAEGVDRVVQRQRSGSN